MSRTLDLAESKKIFGQRLAGEGPGPWGEPGLGVELMGRKPLRPTKLVQSPTFTAGQREGLPHPSNSISEGTSSSGKRFGAPKRRWCLEQVQVLRPWKFPQNSQYLPR